MDTSVEGLIPIIPMLFEAGQIIIKTKQADVDER